MPYELILQNIQKHILLSQQEINYFVGLLTAKTIAKKEFVLKEGELCNTINFVCAGTLRAYYMDASGRESTIMFALSDWWITDIHCFMNQLPAMLFIEALEESVIIQLKKNDLDNLFIQVPAFEKFFRIIMQNAYIREQLRTIETLSLPAEDRYNNFVRKYPQIVQQVTQKQIASYLGITPEFLSTLRKKSSGR